MIIIIWQDLYQLSMEVSPPATLYSTCMQCWPLGRPRTPTPHVVFHYYIPASLVGRKHSGYARLPPQCCVRHLPLHSPTSLDYLIVEPHTIEYKQTLCKPLLHEQEHHMHPLSLCPPTLCVRVLVIFHVRGTCMASCHCGLNHSEPQLVSSLEELGVSPPKTEVRSTRVATAVAEIM